MKELEESIENTIETADLHRITADIRELALDALLKDEVIKSIPIVKWIDRINTVGQSVRDYILLKKVLKFFSQLKDTSIEERSKFIAKIEENEEYNKKVGLAIILILDKLEDFEKPEIIGKLFAANIKGTIDYETFLRLSNLVQNLFLPDLKYLKKFNRGELQDYSKQDELYLAGFLITQPTGGARFDGRNDYAISPYSKTLLEIIEK